MNRRLKYEQEILDFQEKNKVNLYELARKDFEFIQSKNSVTLESKLEQLRDYARAKFERDNFEVLEKAEKARKQAIDDIKLLTNTSKELKILANAQDIEKAIEERCNIAYVDIFEIQQILGNARDNIDIQLALKNLEKLVEKLEAILAGSATKEAIDKMYNGIQLEIMNLQIYVQETD